MADEIQYDYESMDNAYENMKRISSNMESACDEMGADALRLLQSNGGHYADGYHAKLNKLKQDISDLNQEMSGRAVQLQQEFDHMGHADIRLGDGF